MAQSRHANALKLYDGSFFAGKTLRERGGAEYSYSNTGVTIRRGGEVREFAIKWLFGAGHFALTPVLEIDGRAVEHRVSYYAESNRLSLTPGHPAQPAGSIDAALGLVQSAENRTRCFGCHMTGDRPGVNCQNCHGDGANHPRQKQAVKRDGSVALCASCHRSPNEAFASETPELEDPTSIRFAPVGLMASNCYKRSAGKLTCVTCHDPHRNVQPSKTYDAACRSCHAPKAQTCKSDCASCHMPKSSPLPLLIFTDHRIRTTP
ncbi:MAG: hypothetical protein FJW32_03790 [Acidobacteria bacterium]|nr:hypothetical protein [Acidobacteriota bacterium]